MVILQHCSKSLVTSSSDQSITSKLLLILSRLGTEALANYGTWPIYDVNWQKFGGRRLAMCMQSKIVGIVDTTRIPEFSDEIAPS